MSSPRAAFRVVFVVFTSCLAVNVWPPAVTNYRDLLNRLSKNTTEWATAARELRAWMQDNDPDYPLYHLAAPEGWNNDPNGVTFDPHTGLYHRFYQYDPTYSDTKMHGSVSRTWGHTVSTDLVTWEDWPGIYADTPWDERGVFSGNCVFNGSSPHPICIYSNNPCDIGVCATSTDGWVTWTKRACMPRHDAPSAKSQTNHDTSIFQRSDTGEWFLLIGGCTYNAPGSGRDPNVPSPGHSNCQGNAQLWSSRDLWNFTYVGPLTPGGPGGYWELPYLLPFDAQGNAIDNYHQERGRQFVLAFGHGNSYWVGGYNLANHSFVPRGAAVEVDAASGSLAAPVRRAHPAPPPHSSPPLPVFAAWPLANGSAAPSVGNVSGVARGLPESTPGGVGSLFFPGASVAVPFFSALDTPAGFGWSVMIQLPSSALPSGARARLLGRLDLGWGVELWPGSNQGGSAGTLVVLNFYVRPSAKDGATFRAIQCSLPAAKHAGQWVRLSGSFNGSAPLPSNIALWADGAPLCDGHGSQEPGSYAGPITDHVAGANHSPFAVAGDGRMPGVYIADVALYSSPLAPFQLHTITAPPTPPPAPVPVPPATPAPTPSAPGWPAPHLSDTTSYYSINPHAFDRRGANGTTRRLVFGWVTGGVSASVSAKKVPYWQSAHSLARVVTVRNAMMVQEPAPEIEQLRIPSSHADLPAGLAITPNATGFTPHVRGTALEIVASFDFSHANVTAATQFGVVVRQQEQGAGGVYIAYCPASQSIGWGASPSATKCNWFAGIAPQPHGAGTATLRIFLDRSVLEVYTGGAAATSRIMLPAETAASADGVDLFAVGSAVRLAAFESWSMGSMWGSVTTASST